MTREEMLVPLDWRTLDPREVLDVAQDELPWGPAEARYASAARASSTMRGYRADWREWCAWCEQHGVAPLPAAPDQFAAFIAAVADAGAKTGTIGRKLSAVRYAHRVVGLDDPTASARVRMVWEGIRRTIAHEDSPRSRTDQAAPLMPPQLWDVLDACPTMTDWATRPNEPSLAGARDRALLLVGFFGALRRSELVRIDIAHLHTDARGLVLELPYSKTDQFGTRADLVALPRTANPDRCPVRAIDRWRNLAGIETGRLLRNVNRGNKAGAALSEDGVNRIVIQAVQRAGLSTTTPAAVDREDGERTTRRQAVYSAHSLRAGFVTYAHSRGATASQIAHQTRHTSLASVQTYTRLSSVWDDNAVTALGL